MRALALVMLLIPSLVSAATVPAGFPTSSLWLSATELTDGETVTIHSVVYNSSSEPLVGSIEFLVDGAVIGAKSVSTAPGATDLFSQTWTASEGAHEFSARLTGSVEDLAKASTGTTTVTVAQKPPPPESVQKTVEAVGAIEAAIASTTPIVQNFASTTFATTESIRESAVRALEKLASSTAPAGEVLGAEDEATLSPEENAAASFDIGSWLQNIWQAILGAFLVVARSPLWFYVAVAVVLFVLFQFFKTAMEDRRYRD